MNILVSKKTYNNALRKLSTKRHKPIAVIHQDLMRSGLLLTEFTDTMRIDTGAMKKASKNAFEAAISWAHNSTMKAEKTTEEKPTEKAKKALPDLLTIKAKVEAALYLAYQKKDVVKRGQSLREIADSILLKFEGWGLDDIY